MSTPGESADWVRLDDSREAFDAQIEQDKLETVKSLHAWALLIASEMYPGNVDAATAAIFKRAWRLAEPQIEREAEKIRLQIPPTLATVPH
jgi:hypothetical protein